MSGAVLIEGAGMASADTGDSTQTSTDETMTEVSDNQLVDGGDLRLGEILNGGVDVGDMATEHAILTALWHMLAEGECYQDPGSDFFTRRDPDKAKNNALKRLHALGYNVTLTVRQAA